jgi:hypothetical protein
LRLDYGGVTIGSAAAANSPNPSPSTFILQIALVPPNLIPIDFGVRLRSPRLLWLAAGLTPVDWVGRFARQAMR